MCIIGVVFRFFHITCYQQEEVHNFLLILHIVIQQRMVKNVSRMLNIFYLYTFAHY